jgi:hypothetical protein
LRHRAVVGAGGDAAHHATRHARGLHAEAHG